MQIFILILLIVASGSAMAEWAPDGGNDRFTLYSDLTTISKSGNMVKMLRLTDFKAVQGNISANITCQRRGKMNMIA